MKEDRDNKIGLLYCLNERYFREIKKVNTILERIGLENIGQKIIG